MNWDQIEGNWKQFKGRIKEHWVSLSDGDVEMIQGKREHLIGRLQERYGIAKEEAERQLQDFLRTVSAAVPRAEKSGSQAGQPTRPQDQRRTGTGG